MLSVNGKIFTFNYNQLVSYIHTNVLTKIPFFFLVMFYQTEKKIKMLLHIKYLSFVTGLINRDVSFPARKTILKLNVFSWKRPGSFVFVTRFFFFGEEEDFVTILFYNTEHRICARATLREFY